VVRPLLTRHYPVGLSKFVKTPECRATQHAAGPAALSATLRQLPRDSGMLGSGTAKITIEQCKGTMKKILMIAYHYPPVHGSSGVHRTLCFSRYLPEHGWSPIVLTVTPGAYPRIEPSHCAHIPLGVTVERALAMDSARHLAIAGRHLKSLALPDRWISWWLPAVLKGLRLIRQHRPEILWSTYPIATAHLIGLTLQRVTGIRWIADFRDPMTETDPLTGEEHPRDPVLRKMHARIERATLRRCSYAVATTPGAVRMYRERYEDRADSRIALIPNGFDEGSFRSVDAAMHRDRPSDRRLVILHSGLLYPEARDPRSLFAALAQLRERGEISSQTLCVVFRGSGHEALFQSALKSLNIDDIVSFQPIVPYCEALAEMVDADGLLVLQGANCNAQIPAKLYEYLRARRPILALTDPAGDTAHVLLAEGIDTIAPLNARDRIVVALRNFLDVIRRGNAPIASEKSIQHHSRRARTTALAELLEMVIAQPNGDSTKRAAPGR
jgi:hypothetical protein